MGAVREAKGGGDTRKVGVEGVGGHPFVERELHLAILHSLHLLFLTISTFLTMQPFRLASCSYSIGFIFAFCFSLCIANLQALTQFFVWLFMFFDLPLAVVQRPLSNITPFPSFVA